MTTTNTNTATENNAANDSASTEKGQPRLTLIAALMAGDAENVAKVLIKQGRTLDEIKAFAGTFKGAVTSYKQVTAAIEEDRKAEAERLEAEKAEKDKANAAITELAVKAKQKAIESMVAELVAQNVSPEMALEVATKTLSGSTRGSTAPKQKVQVKYKDDVMTVAVTGNNPNKVKDAITESGLTREEFIEKYKTAA